MKAKRLQFLLILCLSVSLLTCKDETKTQKNLDIEETNQNAQDSTTVFSEKSLDSLQHKTKTIKRNRLLEAVDDKANLQELMVSKRFFKEEDLYVLDYNYPHLNEKADPGFRVFNVFIEENYLNISTTENEILEDKELLCDTLKTNSIRDKRIIDYKIYNLNDQWLSTVLYKENYYSGMRYATYLFDCINFDLKNHNFLYFDDVFTPNAEKTIYSTLNSIINEGITSGDLYFECWELSLGDFKAYKNNFIITNDTITYYFDDCVICPSYTGTYSIKIPIQRIMHVLKKYNAPLRVSYTK
ncbi:DUF3298 domain-containing protein [Aquimarina sp. U1-2]|uniref:RsiV family protein n=1 Tax=Aquimarina sp. U1-2 TaxID=2823141 RepID=UPI001AECCCA7|nr:RsiV family protein [Aquimarina sp. U1-2]MBP2831472.1 DUF3298 domain-containing protein [Aquimarina sp. U1-2]